MFCDLFMIELLHFINNIVHYYYFRNEVWRYDGHVSVNHSFRKAFFRGFKYAAAAMVVTIAVYKLFLDKGDSHH